MGSIHNLVKWVKDRTSKKKKTGDKNTAIVRDLPSSTRSSLYGFHKKEHICENALYSKSSGSTGANHGVVPVTARASPFRLYNDSPAHVYEEIPGSMVRPDVNKNEPDNRTNFDIKNLDFTEAKEVGPYLVVPIRKQTMGGKTDKLGFIRSQNLVDMVHSTDSVLQYQTVLQDTTQMCSNRNNRSKLDSQGQHQSQGHLGHSVSDTHRHRQSQHTRQVVAEIHQSHSDMTPEYLPEAYIHCKKCKRPHGIYNEDIMEHYEADDNVFDEPDLIKDSQVRGQGHSQGHSQGQGHFTGGYDLGQSSELVHDETEGALDSDESVYGIREQIYSTTDELLTEGTYTCNSCLSSTLPTNYQQTTTATTTATRNNCDKEEDKIYIKKEHLRVKTKVPYWKKYVSVRKVLFNHKDDESRSSPPITIPGAISYSTVSTRLSPSTQLLLDGRHYKTLPIDLVTPLKKSSTKKPFGYDKLELSKSKAGPRSQYSDTSSGLQIRSSQSEEPTQIEHPVPIPPEVQGHKWEAVQSRGSQTSSKLRSASCSDIIDGSSDRSHPSHHRMKTFSTSEECEYMAMAHGASPRNDNSFNMSTSSEASQPGVAMQRKKAKILKSISKSRSKENLITLHQSGVGIQKSRSISMTDNDIYNCDAETKRKIHQLTRNKLNSTWNGPRQPPKGIQHVLSRHSTLPHSFSPSPKRGVPPPPFTPGASPLQKNSQFTRSSDSLLLPKHLSSKDFHTLNKHSGFPGPLYLRQGGLHGKLKEQQMLRKRRFASSSDCLLSSSIAEESPSNFGSEEKLSCRATPQFPRRRRSLSYDANAQTYTNAAAIAQNQACSYQRRHNPILSDLMRVNNDRQTLMLV